MKKTKIVAALAAVVMATTLASCGGATKEVAILVPSPDHGWTGAVGTYADEYVKELNAAQEGGLKYKIYTSANSDDQIKIIDDLLVRKDQIAGVAILPWDNGAASGISKLANSTIPFTMFDRIIDNEDVRNSKVHVSNVKGDNTGIGSATAAKFLELGLKETDKVLVMPGDNSSVPEMRNNGFKTGIQTKYWNDDAAWAEHVVSTEATGWSRDKSVELFTTWLKQNATDENLNGFKYVFTHDSEISMGIMEVLASNAVTEAEKEVFKKNVKVIASSSGLEEMYQVIRGDHPRSAEFNKYVGDMKLFDVTYDPAMIKIAIKDVIDHLAGKTVVKDHVIPVEVIDASNVKDRLGFGGKVSK